MSIAKHPEPDFFGAVAAYILPVVDYVASGIADAKVIISPRDAQNGVIYIHWRQDSGRFIEIGVTNETSPKGTSLTVQCGAYWEGDNPTDADEVFSLKNPSASDNLIQIPQNLQKLNIGQLITKLESARAQAFSLEEAVVNLARYV